MDTIWPWFVVYLLSMSKAKAILKYYSEPMALFPPSVALYGLSCMLSLLHRKAQYKNRIDNRIIIHIMFGVNIE